MKKLTQLPFNLRSYNLRFFFITSILFFLLSTGSHTVHAQTIDVPAGSVVIDMGVVPQTIGNGLKPYGLAFSLIKDYNTPIQWCIESTKVKDGIDFTVDGRDFRGGTFVILEEFLSAAVLAEIANWEGQGVVTYTTQSAVTAPLYKELSFFANWVTDTTNGVIAEAYLDDAGIPATAWVRRLPTELDTCDDLFIMPHADPNWTDHGQALLDWNAPVGTVGIPTSNAGFIWAGCHAVSALEDLYNPANPAEQTNFLSIKTMNATNNGNDYFENALNLWNTGHDDASGTTPYSNAFPNDPFMQFLGNTDGAHAGGSEQIYLPVIGGGWRTTTKIGAWDPNQADIPGLTAGEAAIIAYGPAFGDINRGQVMYEGGHRLDNGTEAENVAAQRVLLNFSFDAPAAKVPTIVENAPPVTLVLENGDSVSFDITGTPSNPISGITYSWSSSCSIGTFDDPTSATPTFTLPATPGITVPEVCIINGQVSDDCGRIAFVSYGFTLIPPPAPPVANDDSAATYNTTPISLNALNNDTDINENIVSSSFTPQSPLVVAGGTFTDNGNGDITFTPAAGFSGTATLDYQICDDTPAGDGGPFCDTATITITVAAGSCNPGETVSQVTDYALSVNSENQWKDSDRALGAPDNQYSKADNDAGTGWLILDLGGDAYIGSTIKFRIYSDDGNPVSGSIDAAVLTTDFPTANQTTVNVTTQDPATDIVTFTVNQAGIRYVRITGATKKFGLESVEYEKEICIVPPPTADLSLTNTIDNATPTIGQTVTFSITITNSGPDDATGVQVRDLLPTGMVYDLANSTIPAGTTYDEVTGVWDLSGVTIANGASFTLEIAAAITPACGEITNVAEIISSDLPDPDSTINNGN